MKEALTFDDVLLVPQKSTVSPRKVTTETWLTEKIKLEIPLLSAAMDTVTESAMAIALAQTGGLGIIHKNLPIEKQAEEVKKVKAGNLLCGASVSIGEPAIQRAKALAEAGVDAIVIDVAHGHYYKVAETISALKKLFGQKIVLIGGNVATAQATIDLIKAGADVIKVGVGPGSICTTRIIAGIGVPQLTAVMDAVKAAKKTGTPVIADGGIKFSGDIVKALAAGAAAVMLGGLFAGTDEAPGEIIEVNGPPPSSLPPSPFGLDKTSRSDFGEASQKMKVYRGMGSIDAMQQGSNDRYLQADKKTIGEMIAEGVVGHVPYKGPVKNIIYQLIGGLKQGLGYCGARNISELQKKAEFVRVSPAGLRESHPHSLQNIKQAPNYKSDFI